MHDVICSERVTMHFQWGRKVSLVTLTFDLDIQTRPSVGPQSPHVNLAQIRSAVPEIFHKQAKSHKQRQNRTLRSLLRAVIRV